MGRLYDLLMKDYRLKEGLNACINCGTCTAICPAAEFYRYDPRRIVDIVQSKDDEEIEKLLKSDTIWYCGECMSCVTRCPRKNAPGLIIMALRSLSIDLGYFIESEKGRQQCLLVKDLCANILDYGYCVYPRRFDYAGHPEAGKVWEWEEKHLDDVFERLGGNLDGDGPGAMRRMRILTSSGGSSTRPGRPKGWRRCGRRVSERPPRWVSPRTSSWQKSTRTAIRNT